MKCEHYWAWWRDDITAGLIICNDAASYTLITLDHTLRGVNDKKKFLSISVDGALKDCLPQELLHAYNDLLDATIEKAQTFMNDYIELEMFEGISVFKAKHPFADWKEGTGERRTVV